MRTDTQVCLVIHLYKSVLVCPAFEDTRLIRFLPNIHLAQ